MARARAAVVVVVERRTARPVDAWRAAVSHTLNEIIDSVKSKLVERA